MQSPLFIGTNLLELEKVDSTNRYAALLLKEQPLPEGTVIMAYTQEEGKGQRGNSWLSEPGKNLTFSVILYPRHIRADRQFLLTQCISLAIAQSIRAAIPGSDVKIKWPNDIYCSGKKAAGILIENNLRGDLISSSIAGIGLNVNQVNFEGLAGATSMKKLAEKDFDLKQLLTGICQQLEAFYLLSKSDTTMIESRYRESLFRLGTLSRFSYQDKEIEARIEGTDSTGKLLLTTAENEQLQCDLKEIAYLFD